MKKLNKILTAAVMVVSMVALSSCSMISGLFGDGLAGNTYVNESTETETVYGVETTVSESITISFDKKNGVKETYVMSTKMAGFDFASLTAEISGTYDVDDNKLTVKVTSIDSIAYKQMNMMTGELETVDDADEIAEMKADAKEEGEMSCTYEINKDKDLVITENGKSTIYKKVTTK